jgi:hypothetical protein
MPRLIELAGAAIIGSQLLCAGVMASPTTEPRPDGPPHAAPRNFVEPAGNSLATHHVRHMRKLELARAATAGRATARAAEPLPPVPPTDAAGADSSAAQPPDTATQSPGDGDVITPWQIMTRQEIRVSHIAWLNGDRKYLMVDKALGKILLFEDGRPVYIARALTGESLSDQVLPEEIAGKMADLNALKYKVTPAGRFTISRHYDPHYGYLFDINELHGKDWSIALHRVYLGTPSEHRDERLASPRDDDKNISFGCINVTPETEAYLLTQLPENGTPLYVLPRDKEETQAAFSRDGTFSIAAAAATDQPVASSSDVASSPVAASSSMVASSPAMASSPASNAPVLFSAVSASSTSAAATMGSPTPDPRQNMRQIPVGQSRSTP